jgi:hypothetical protein
MEYYSAIRKNGIMFFEGKWMELQVIILSEISQTHKNNYCMLFSYVEFRF